MASIFLGRAHIPIKSGNLLSNTFHPHYGWVWTDGNAVFLLSSSENGMSGDAATSRKLGDYGEVRRLSWSHCTKRISRCFLAVQQSKLVTIWEVFGEGENPEFKLYKKIDAVTDMRDIIWHPVCPIICLVSSSGSWLYCLDPDWSVQINNHQNLAGCWMPDGKTLVLAADRNISVYVWDDINGGQENWTQRQTKVLTMTRFKGKVVSILAVSSQHIIAATDLPLMDVISQSNEDTFEPIIINSHPTSKRTLITEIGGNSVDDLTTNIVKKTFHSVEMLREPCKVRSTNILDNLKEEIMSREKGPLDLTAMLSVFAAKKVNEKQTESENVSVNSGIEVLDKDLEVHLGRREKEKAEKYEGLVGASPLFTHETFVKKEELAATGSTGWNVLAGSSVTSAPSVPIFKKAEKIDVEDSAHLHLLDVSLEEPIIVNSSKVPGMMSPDLVSFKARSNTLYVSNRSNQHFQVFHVKNGDLEMAEQKLHLTDLERPVGIQCGLHEDVVSVLVSKPATMSMAAIFPMATGTQQVDLYLKQIHLSQA
ncbi:WD repeat and coiled-coil-containing protein-like [Apostichopus japonicus]|uniref:WD repeat and coiled-coil-containing protein-like n=1 Tax=Stichopus japonicus TaxID=307972 RepID=UPI003AB6C1E2